MLGNLTVFHSTQQKLHGTIIGLPTPKFQQYIQQYKMTVLSSVSTDKQRTKTQRDRVTNVENRCNTLTLYRSENRCNTLILYRSENQPTHLLSQPDDVEVCNGDILTQHVHGFVLLLHAIHQPSVVVGGRLQ